MSTPLFSQALTRRQLGLIGAAALAPALGGVPAALAQAASFPTRPVRIVLPFPPGAVNDLVLRLLSERLAQRWGQAVMVENKPGGGTIIGTDTVAKAAPDGHTLLANVSSLVQNPWLRKKLPYDTVKDISPVTQINRQQLLVVARGNLPVKSYTELIAYAKAHPGKLNFATFGIATTPHMIHEMTRHETGAEMVHVPYRGSQEIMKALLTNEADVAVSDLLTPSQYFADGRIRPIAVTGPERAVELPQVQTLKEAGVSGFDRFGWLGLFAPGGTPAPILRQIAADLAAVQSDPALVKRFSEMMVHPVSDTPEQFKQVVEQDMALWGKVIKTIGVSVD